VRSTGSAGNVTAVGEGGRVTVAVAVGITVSVDAFVGTGNGVSVGRAVDVARAGVNDGEAVGCVLATAIVAGVMIAVAALSSRARPLRNCHKSQPSRITTRTRRPII